MKRPVQLVFFYCARDESKSELARNLDDRLQSRNALFGAFGDSERRRLLHVQKKVHSLYLLILEDNDKMLTIQNNTT